MTRLLSFVLFCLLKPYCEAQILEHKEATQVKVFPKPYKYDSHKENHQERLIQKLGPDDAVSEFIEKAEDKSNIIINKNGLDYKALQSEIVFDGSSAFNLVVTAQTFKSTYITLNPAFKINDNTTLQFVSWMRTALVGQTARVQVSLQNGKWQEIFSQSGPMKGGGVLIDGDSSWTLRTIDLSGFTGKIVRIRFMMDAGNSAAFSNTGPKYGWFIDNIQIGSNAFEKKLYSIGQPTDGEQYSVELINRARKDPVKELELLIDAKDPELIKAYDYFNVDMSLLRTQFSELKPAQALSISEPLTIVARGHSGDMVKNKFQGHVSSDGSTLGQRVVKVTSEFGGYVSENVAAYSKSISYGHAALLVDWGISSVTGKSKGGMQDPPGHRLNIYDKEWTQVGVGAIPNGEMNEEVAITQNFGAVGQFITGVVYFDKNENDFYDPGEGLSGAQINSRMISGETQSPYYAISSESGGYSVPVSSKGGDYIVSFSHPLHGNWSAHITTKDSTNKKADWILKLKPPQITQQPQSQTVLVGETASMEVKASGRGPLEYQWYKGSSRIHGAVNSIYSITKVSETHSGKYKVKVSNSIGSVFSQQAQLKLLAPPKIDLQPRTQSIEFSFTTENEKIYIVEVTQDFKQWGELQSYKGTGQPVKFTDPRQPNIPFKRNYYRIKLVE